METKVSFSLNKPAATATKRKRPRSTASPITAAYVTVSEVDGERSRVLTGCFDVTVDEAVDHLRDANGNALVLTKQPRLQLEDATSKSKRLQDEGNTLAEAGRFRAAMARWMEATVVDPENAVIYELLAQASMALFEDFRAIQFALKATQLARTWGDAFHTLARCHLNYGELELALQHINKAIELNRSSEELVADREEIQRLLVKQSAVIAKREAEEATEVDEGRLQALSCLKHLSLRGQTKLDDNDTKQG